MTARSPRALVPPGDVQSHGICLWGAPMLEQASWREWGTAGSELVVARPCPPRSAERQPLHELIARGISDSVNDPLEEMRGKNTGGKQKNTDLKKPKEEQKGLERGCLI